MIGRNKSKLTQKFNIVRDGELEDMECGSGSRAIDNDKSGSKKDEIPREEELPTKSVSQVQLLSGYVVPVSKTSLELEQPCTEGKCDSAPAREAAISMVHGKVDRVKEWSDLFKNRS